MNKVLILTPDSERFASLVKERRLPQLSIVASDDLEQGAALVRDCNIILGQPALVARILADAQHLEWVQSTFAGIEALCAPGLSTDYVLTGVKGVFGSLISEYVFSYILAMERHLLETHANQQNGVWKDIPYRGLEGLTLGVCGLGAIGTRVAQTAAHFGMRVLGFNRSGKPNPHTKQVFSASSLTPFLNQLDYLVITAPGTPETNHSFNYTVLQQMKSSAVLINVGRGSVVAEHDLLRALQNKIIRAAVLDVFEQEPLPASSPLWRLPNVFITPHNAAVSFAEDIVAIFADNYTRFLKREPLEYVVDVERGY